MRVLLLCDYRPSGAATVLDHIHAIERDSGHDVERLSLFGDLPDTLDLGQYDAIILHYSLVVSNDDYVSPLARQRISCFKGLKAIFIQDEYRWVNQAIDAMRFLGIHLLFTCVPEAEIEKVYSNRSLPGVRKVNVLTGYVPANLLSHPPITYQERRLDVGYRARRLSAAFGRLGREKWKIAEEFSHIAKHHSLVSDISFHEHDRLYGEDWINFVKSCKAMLGVESGASVFDWEGQILPRVQECEEREPERDFESIESEYFPGLDGAVSMNQISPRCFESAALRTMMVLYEGEYSGILEPWRHFVPLKKDLSNQEEVVEAIQNENTWNAITENAYREVAENTDYSFATFGKLVGDELKQCARSIQYTPQVKEKKSTAVTLPQVKPGGKTTGERLGEARILYEQTLLNLMPPRAHRQINYFVRALYRGLLGIYRPVGILKYKYRRFKELTAVLAKQDRLGVIALLRTVTNGVLYEEIEMILRLRTYGLLAAQHHGRAEFSLCFDRKNREATLFMTTETSHAKNESLANEEMFWRDVQMLKTEFNSAENEGLRVVGLPNRRLSELLSLIKQRPLMGLALFGEQKHSERWCSLVDITNQKGMGN